MTPLCNTAASAPWFLPCARVVTSRTEGIRTRSPGPPRLPPPYQYMSISAALLTSSRLPTPRILTEVGQMCSSLIWVSVGSRPLHPPRRHGARFGFGSQLRRVTTGFESSRTSVWSVYSLEPSHSFTRVTTLSSLGYTVACHHHVTPHDLTHHLMPPFRTSRRFLKVPCSHSDPVYTPSKEAVQRVLGGENCNHLSHQQRVTK